MDQKNFDFNEAMDLINKYSKIYHEFECFQQNSKIMPTSGDQKTGVIGEMYIYEYLQRENPNDKIVFGNASNKGWDIKVGESRFIQVKTVSAHSKTRTISNIHEGWTELFLVSLNFHFIPNGVWVIKDPNHIKWTFVQEKMLDENGNALKDDNNNFVYKKDYKICKDKRMIHPEMPDFKYTKSFFKDELKVTDITTSVLTKLKIKG